MVLVVSSSGGIVQNQITDTTGSKHNYFFLPTKNCIPTVNAEETQKIKYNYLYSKRQHQTLLIDPV